MTAHAGARPATEPSTRAAGARKADRATRHTFRSQRVLPALAAALLMTAAGVLTAIEVISAALGHPARIFPYGWVRDANWDGVQARAVFAALALIGVWFVLAAVLPGRSRIVPLHGRDPSLMMGVSRRGLKRSVAAAAEGAPGVSGVSRVRLGRRRVRVVAKTPVREPTGLDAEITRVVRERLDRLDPLPARSVAVRMKHREA
ncbi:hypothetical protein GCM10010402_15370 [Actinomadura luteofluorescens]|uniref:DUF6286 domain-containing protein n=1 Tax=Actinomadura luteofluorescens TaxID=46163 RepID=UPI002164758E|nr:DUF6286 domain-containing protein [Actinomadura glauciflava]MCR3744031.1 hypothetical protein [Actinomadura glauciflava]